MRNLTSIAFGTVAVVIAIALAALLVLLRHRPIALAGGLALAAMLAIPK
jgi:hypothetical protein